MLTLYNTLTQKKEVFTPLHPHTATLYHCGPTVYQYAHIGNLRAYVCADTLRRTLELSGLTITQVINITDVGHLVSDSDTGNDKVEEGAKKEGKTPQEITRFYTDAFFEDLKNLNIETTDTQFPRATEYIAEQIALIKRLQEKGYTYQTSDGIYFDTAQFPTYGALGNINIKGLQEGARVAQNVEKKNPTDFALWKLSVPRNAHPESDEGLVQSKRQQEWESPWGVGFPGWHIECSAMAMKLLGETVDIHTGGIDHIPVHHNNEIAQSESATGKKFARFWLHNAFVTVGDEKMAKSAGNFYRLEDIKQKGFHPLSYRYLLLTTHYRSPLHFTWEALSAAETALRRLTEYVKVEKEGVISSHYEKKFRTALENDLDTPQAIALMWEIAKDDSVSPEEKKATLLFFDTVLGLSLPSLSSALNPSLTEIPTEIVRLVEERERARKEKNWGKADILRKEIERGGFSVKDTDKGVAIEKLRS